ncbi:HMG box domain-containing protein [Mycena sanguinolenta]|uniref:HMG box domain-containing protein n=1 Tax=Mycena sanguinolenta TaxID=230812 RepID=A0A8H6ZB63_9AGAR|nr:HMG box domain-containing protein [Mycena sanguinolenta]
MPPIRHHNDDDDWNEHDWHADGQVVYTFLGDEDDAEEAARFEEVEEDDDMPPLVDAPPLPADAQYDDQYGEEEDDKGRAKKHKETQESMMSSIDFSGVSFAGGPFAPTLVPPPQDASSGSANGIGRGRKTRLASSAPGGHIPRPPNAFILFRSSFIRSQNVPGRVEGNHSTLSKIIGKVWHSLPATERARWEDKARAAQAEHRRRYPDWRFRTVQGNGNGGFKVYTGKEKPKRRRGRIKDPDPEPASASTSASAFAHTPDDDGPRRGRTRTRARGRGGAAKDADQAEGQDAGDGGHGREGEGEEQLEHRKGKGKGKARASPVKGRGKARARSSPSSSPHVPFAASASSVSTTTAATSSASIASSTPATVVDAVADAKEEARRWEEARCDQITTLLVAGKRGSALERAVEEWEVEWDREMEDASRSTGTTPTAAGREAIGTSTAIATPTAPAMAGRGRTRTRVRADTGTGSTARTRVRRGRERESPDKEEQEGTEKQQQDYSTTNPTTSPSTSPDTPTFAFAFPPPSPLPLPFSPSVSSSTAFSPSVSTSPFASPYLHHSTASVSGSPQRSPYRQQRHSPQRSPYLHHVSASPQRSPFPPPPQSPYTPFASPYLQHASAAASPYLPQASPFASSLSASPVPERATAAAAAAGGIRGGGETEGEAANAPGENDGVGSAGVGSALPLTHLYKRSLSAPCAGRVALPEGAVGASSAVVDGGQHGQEEEQERGEVEQEYASSPVSGVFPPAVQGGYTYAGQGQGGTQQHQVPQTQHQTHARRDTVSFPLGHGRTSYQQHPAPQPQHHPGPHHPVPQQSYPQQRYAHRQPTSHTHARRDTISFPLPTSSRFPFGLPATSARAGTAYPHPYLHPHDGRGHGYGGGYGYGQRAHGAYTYPPPYAHTPLPDVGEGVSVLVDRGDGAGGDISAGGDVDGGAAANAGPAPRYAGASDARRWWGHLRGDAVDADEDRAGAADADGDAGWADQGVEFKDSPAPVPSPSPPATPHIKEPYALPLSPISPMSDERGGDVHHNENTDTNDTQRIRFPPLGAGTPAISSFSTLSGWAGDFAASPMPAPPTSAAASFPASFAPAQQAPAGGTSASGADVERTSGWYQAPGWENAVQGATGLVVGVGDAPWPPLMMPSRSASGPTTGYIPPPPLPLKAPWVGQPTQEWPVRADVEMYDANVGGGAGTGAWGAPR